MLAMKDKFAGVDRYRHFINGQWVDSTAKEWIEVENPATGAVIATVPRGTADDADRALVVAGALLINYVVAAEQIPNEIGDWIQTLHVSRFGFLLVINLMFLVLGCFLDTLLMLLVIVPIVMPSITGLGIDKVHFGVTTIVNLMIGMITPPYSELLFVVTGITGISLTAMYRYIWPFIIALVVALLIMLAFPDVVLWLPIQFGYTPGD